MSLWSCVLAEAYEALLLRAASGERKAASKSKSVCEGEDGFAVVVARLVVVASSYVGGGGSALLVLGPAPVSAPRTVGYPSLPRFASASCVSSIIAEVVEDVEEEKPMGRPMQVLLTCARGLARAQDHRARHLRADSILQSEFAGIWILPPFKS